MRRKEGEKGWWEYEWRIKRIYVEELWKREGIIEANEEEKWSKDQEEWIRYISLK